MKRFMLTVALTCVLSVSALAGEMPTMGITSPAPGNTQGPTLLQTVILAIITLPR
jgi:hypothetical protein